MPKLSGYLVVSMMDLRPGMVRTDGAVLTTLPVRQPNGIVTFETDEGRRWGVAGQSVLVYDI